MVGRTPAASSEPPAERRPSADLSKRRRPSLERSERSEPVTPHTQLAMGAMERLAPVLYVRSYRSLRRRIAEKTASRATVRRDLPRPSYTPQQRAELQRVYSRSLSRPLPAPAPRLGGSRGVTPSSESPRTRDATPSTPERQVRRPLLPLWTPADITVKEDPLDSEARLAARRQARAEAREIRMRELERQQREAEQNGERLDDFSDVSPRPAPSAVSSRASRGPSAASTGRRGSEDSAEDGASTSSGGFHLRDVRHELRELEEKLRKTMVTSAQLDNDKSTLSYQVELLKDKLEEMQEAHTQLQREHRARCSEHEQLKRVSNRLREDYECCKTLLEERDKLIAENGLVLVGDEEDDSEPESAASAQRPHKALVSQNAAQLLDKAGGGTLDSRLRRLGEEKNELEDQLRRLKLELEEERHMSARARISGSGAGAESDQVQREVARQVGEYRFKLQKADQDITNLQTAVQRLENQVARYKAAAETAEKSEEELKGEKRKLQRELREAQQQVDELDSAKKTMERQQRLRRL